MIHQYKNNGYSIVLDVNSGSVHVVDDIVYDSIALRSGGRGKQRGGTVKNCLSGKRYPHSIG